MKMMKGLDKGYGIGMLSGKQLKAAAAPRKKPAPVSRPPTKKRGR
jgi:hypothetical protein